MNDTEIDDTAEEATQHPRDAEPWLDMIQDGTRVFENWQYKAANCEKLYADLERLGREKADREFQMFWANLEVLKPSVYARPPIPVVMPTFRDRTELKTKTAELLERTLVASFEVEDVHVTLKEVRDDMLIAGRGALWLRYEAEQDEEGGLEEEVCYEHVPRMDFLHEPARKWKEVGWVARRSYLSREKGLNRFGEVFLQCEFSEQKDKEGKDYGDEKKAEVWEIWHKTKKVVVWVSKGVQEVLDIQDPFLDLDGFFPCPKPAYATIQPGTLIPVPDILYYRDQIEEINELTARISALSESLRLRGFYGSGEGNLADAIEKAIKETDNGAVLVPVNAGAMIAGGKMSDAIAWLPLTDIANTIKELVALRKQLIDDVYQITGLSDIMRGSTKANETLGAQQLKSQYGSIRIRERQAELVRLARDCTRMAGEIIAENFQPQTLLLWSQLQIPDQMAVQQQVQQLAAQHQQKQMMAQQQAMQQGQEPPPMQPFQPPKSPVMIEQIMELLRSQRMRPFAMEIETDSTIQPDEDAEKQRRTEFTTAVGGFIGQAFPIVQAFPPAAPMAAETLKFLASGFRAGRQLEAAIDEFAEAIKNAASAPKPPNPETEKLKMEAQIEQRRAEADIGLKQLDAKMKELELQIKQFEVQGKGIEAQAKQAEAMASMNQPQGEVSTPLDDEEQMAKIDLTYAQADKVRADTQAVGADRMLKANEIAVKEKQANKPAPARAN